MRSSLVVGINLFSAFLLFSDAAVAQGVGSECDAVPDNIVANCAFETGAFTPEWTASDGSVEGVGTHAHTGNFGVFIGEDCLSQTLRTVPGQSYDLSYWSSAGGPWGGWTFNEVWVSWNDAPIDHWSSYAMDNPYFQRRVGSLIGTGADTLRFCHSTEGFDGWYTLDDIVVQ